MLTGVVAALLFLTAVSVALAADAVYLQASDSPWTVEGEQRLFPRPGQDYEEFLIILGDASARIAQISAGLAFKARFQLAPAQEYRYAFDALTGRAHILDAQDNIVVALPLNAAGTTSLVRIGDEAEWMRLALTQNAEGSFSLSLSPDANPGQRAGLRFFASQQEFEQHVQAALNHWDTTRGDQDGVTGLPPVAMPDAPETDAAGSPDFSVTNIQEAGVDQADRSRSDGQKLYVLHRNEATNQSVLRILALANDAPPRVDPLSQLEFKEQTQPDTMYLLAPERETAITEKKLLLLGGHQFRDWIGIPMPVEPLPTDGPRADMMAVYPCPYCYWSPPVTTLWLVDIQDPRTPAIEYRLSLDGELVSSRRIGSQVHIVTRFNDFQPVRPYYDAPAIADVSTNAAPLVSKADTAAVAVPHVSLNDGERIPLVSGTQCLFDPAREPNDWPELVTITTLDISTTPPGMTTRCIVGSTEAIYASPQSLYLATTHYDTLATPDTVTDHDAVRERLPWPMLEVSTRIHKFALTASGTQYRGSGLVTGHLGWEQDKKAFRLSEYQGHLRVVTSVGQTWDGSATTRLFILAENPQQQTLEIIAQLPNARRPEAIGKPGERLYASRFLGERGYLVTFLVTDPLYTLDLSDPTDPFIAGELEITGYSDYLHLLEPDLLLGIGRDALADSADGETAGLFRGAWEQGVKLALFDVSNPARPVELDSLILGKRGSYAPILHDHQAMSILTRRDADAHALYHRLALPVILHDRSTGSEPLRPWTYHDWTHTGLHLFTIRDGKIQPHGEMLTEHWQHGNQRWISETDRSLLRSEEAHYIRGGAVWSAPWDALDQVIGPQ